MSNKNFKLLSDGERGWYDFNEYFWRSPYHFHIKADGTDPLFFGLKSIFKRGDPIRHEEVPAFVKAVYLNTWTT